jgi:deoxyadenosine/deoxycytidine kinase
MNNVSAQAPLVSIIGPPASGKTTLAEALAVRWKATLIREDYAGNPFLAESYVGDDSLRLPGQLYFLMSRAGQLGLSDWPCEGRVVSDYGFCQDRVYASLRLPSDDFATYDRIARRIEPLVKSPELIVLLKADVAVLQDRIRGRGRDYERAMTPRFLFDSMAAYEVLAGKADCPVVACRTDEQDVRTEAVADAIYKRIEATL